ncbi:MAG: GNAT family protein [Pseudomonadota bacterium]
MNAKSKIEGLEELYPRPLSGAPVTSLPSAMIPARTELAGEVVTLEPQDAERHARALYAVSHGSDEALRIWDYLPVGPWASEAEFVGVIRGHTASFDPIFYTIRDNASGRYVGQVSFLDIRAQNGVIEIGYIWFAPELQRTRGATEALYLTLCYAMDDLGYRRMQWRCNSLNAKSRNAARRLGFRFEGIFYNHLIFKGKNRDTAWYSILDDEWPEVKQIIGSWLDASNFEADGKARTSLAEAMQHRSPSTRG